MSSAAASPGPPRRSWRRRLLRGCAWGCAIFLLLLAGLIGLLIFLLQKTPRHYPLVAQPIPPPTEGRLGGGLDGFDSPYIGHTGSWDGKGGAWGGSKIAALDSERAMGLRWTFMPVYWRAMEPDGPVDLSHAIPAAWRELDAFVIAAHDRGLNILMQAPVVGGNAGGPPAWAGRRQAGHSAPANMEAAAAFAGKLAQRYCPGGTLARQQGWGDRFGVRAWELDNEPEVYLTNWKGQAGDYAEFVTKSAAAIRQADPAAVIVGPGIGGDGHGTPWVEETLDSSRIAGSPSFRQAGQMYSIGKVLDVVSFHCYEGLETAFSRNDRTLTDDFSDIRAVFEKYERAVPGFEYERKQEYWHTEGNYDFIGVLSRTRRAAWRMQFLTRGFAAGIRKLAVMDASAPEQASVRAYVSVLPNPFPMLPATEELSAVSGQVAAFRHPDGPEPGSGRVWILWAVAGTGDATAAVPVIHQQAELISVSGEKEIRRALAGRIELNLKGDAKMAPPVLVVDR